MSKKVNQEMKKKKLVIIGNGLATMQLLKELDHQQDYAVTVLSAENVPHYNRIMLSSLLAQETDLQSITPCDSAWYQERNVSVLLNHRVTQINSALQLIHCENGAEFSYDKLIFATGSRAFIPPMLGTKIPEVLEGVMGFRKLIDVDFMQQVTSLYNKAVVIGAGLLGIEAAVGLAKQGMDVTLLHRRDVLMNRQIDRNASNLLIKELESRNIKIATGHGPVALHGCSSATQEIKKENANTSHSNRKQVTEVELDNGTRLTADLVIFATGIVPCTPLAQASGLEVKKGICVDAQLQTSQQNIFALGECCEFEGNTYGLVAPIWNQAHVLAKQLLRLAQQEQNESLPESMPVYFEESFATKLKVSGIDVHSMGVINPEDTELECDVLEFNDNTRGIYKKILLNDHKLIGAVLYGDVADSQWYFELLQQGLNTESFRQELIFGQALCSE